MKNKQAKVKATFVIPRLVKEHLELASTILQTDQSDITSQALSEWFQRRGVDVNKPLNLPTYEIDSISKKTTV